MEKVISPNQQQLSHRSSIARALLPLATDALLQSLLVEIPQDLPSPERERLRVDGLSARMLQIFFLSKELVQGSYVRHVQTAFSSSQFTALLAGGKAQDHFTTSNLDVMIGLGIAQDGLATVLDRLRDLYSPLIQHALKDERFLSQISSSSCNHQVDRLYFPGILTGQAPTTPRAQPKTSELPKLRDDDLTSHILPPSLKRILSVLDFGDTNHKDSIPHPNDESREEGETSENSFVLESVRPSSYRSIAKLRSASMSTAPPAARARTPLAPYNHQDEDEEVSVDISVASAALSCTGPLPQALNLSFQDEDEDISMDFPAASLVLSCSSSQPQALDQALLTIPEPEIGPTTFSASTYDIFQGLHQDSTSHPRTASAFTPISFSPVLMWPEGPLSPEFRYDVTCLFSQPSFPAHSSTPIISLQGLEDTVFHKLCMPELNKSDQPLPPPTETDDSEQHPGRVYFGLHRPSKAISGQDACVDDGVLIDDDSEGRSASSEASTIESSAERRVPSTIARVVSRSTVLLKSQPLGFRSSTHRDSDAPRARNTDREIRCHLPLQHPFSSSDEPHSQQQAALTVSKKRKHVESALFHPLPAVPQPRVKKLKLQPDVAVDASGTARDGSPSFDLFIRACRGLQRSHTGKPAVTRRVTCA